jgi:enoyl-CoA hydratase/carnithine racemase
MAEQALVLHTKSAEGITTITINRPQSRNAVNAATARQLADAFRAFETDETQKVCVFTGAGETFCAGYDLHEVARSGFDHRVELAEPTEDADLPPGPMGPSRMALTKPVIAAVAGHAVAGGLELSLIADMRVADTTAIFGVFCRRFGVPLIDGGTIRLPKVIGMGRAMDMILTGRPVDAQEALSFGLANRVVEKGTALEEATKLARSLLQFPQKCMRADLQSAKHGAYDADSIHEALKFEHEHGSRVLEEESVHGAARFSKGEGRSGSFDLSKM